MSAEGSAAISPSTSVQVSLFSYGHANGPIVQQHREARYHKTLHYNIRHLPNPPRHLRAKSTGLSRRLQKEFLHNTNVEEFLVKVQGELLNAVKQECGQLLHSMEQKEIERRPCETDERSDTSAHSSEEVTDIDVVVTICCEEGHHRSVAFVEELARRLAMFKQGDGLSQRWLLSVDVTHRDIEELEDNGQPLISISGQIRLKKSPDKWDDVKKVDRYKSPLEDDDGES